MMYAGVFNLAIGIYVYALRRLGALDYRSARVLVATWFGRTYRACCLLRSERYRVADEEAMTVYAADIKANQGPFFQRFSKVLVLLAVIFSAMGICVSIRIGFTRQLGGGCHSGDYCGVPVQNQTAVLQAGTNLVGN